ncbi:MAG: 16S rRNA (cytosine(1402)-N(4))-methyltransferase RsmH [Bacteroidales bacterium]|nr:16S rRNA (cytosine(1402)-N(4))-methyltransferase RsmH [Bacteroidales bacterium]
MEVSSTYHNAVMLSESIDGLNVKQDGVYVDVTFGGGGHSREIMRRLGSNGRLYAFDQDEDSKANAIADERFTLINHNFKHIKNYLKVYGVTQVDGILADLGVSSHQFDSKDRGFSTRMDCELDMRMDRKKGLTAAMILNTYSEEQLKNLFFEYGEIKNAKKLASLIVSRRMEKPFLSSLDFQNSIQSCIPVNRENKYLAQVYQALRIKVNDEMEALQQLLSQSASLIKEGGRLVVLSYHSLEDRMTKIFMRSGNFEDKIEKDFYGNILSPFKQIDKLTPTDQELQANPRSRSAKLRIAERRAIS